MEQRHYKTIGIIGGMGPLATVDLMTKIIRCTVAACDQEHIPLLVYSNTAIPDRTAAILLGGEDPVPELRRAAQTLEKAGAHILVMACNTAHYFYDRICEPLSIPLLHMPRETAAQAARSGIKRVALLATDGTVASGIYDHAFEKAGVELLKPNVREQALVMDMSYGLKAGREDLPVDSMQAALNRLTREGAEAFILGCTELPLIFEKYPLQVPALLDPTEVTARRAVQLAGGKLK
ncbi:MAG: amino acid racemase [Candidatus Pelethousia sp.]|nr:amino acid racemase [Candidatus Pelethousia sp.]